MSSSFESLKQRVGLEWPAITAAQEQATEHIKILRDIIGGPTQAHTSVVAFGSLARGEWTTGSDVDWTLLIDGASSMQHFAMTRAVEDVLKGRGYKEPGPTGTFGSMSSSHELVHKIGGSEDSNQNLTRRMLLLLESVALSDSETHDRVITAILERYVIGGPPATSPTWFHVPLFLLNDIVRYWRTITVDYETKKWQRGNAGWALKNIKLRFSRKLLIVKGMLMCFLCDGSFSGKPESDDPEFVESEILKKCRHFTSQSAIDVLCHALMEFASHDTATKTINAYDAFLSMLNDEDKRNELKCMPFEQSMAGDLYREMSVHSRQFRDGIIELFFDSNADLAKLTKRFGVF